MNYFRIVAAALALALCYLPLTAGTGSAAPFSAGARSVRYGSAYFKIKVPPRATPPSLRRIRPHYISSSTKSFDIAVDGSHADTANVNPSNGYATAIVRATVGTHIFTVSAYDKLDAKGTVLSTGSTAPIDVPESQITIYLTLSGVVASVELALDYPNPTLGSPAVINLNLIAKDPDGNVILAPGTPFTRPITLTTSDAVNGKLSFTTIQATPDTYSRLRVAYSGANVRQITFSATGGGLAPGAVTPATLIPHSPPTSGEQLIAQQDDDVTAVFSTLPSHQLLGTFTNPFANDYFYGSVAVDDVNRLIYLGNQVYPHQQIDIFSATGVHAQVGSIAAGPSYLGGLAIDSADGKVFSLQYDGEYKYNDIYVNSTAPGHALLSKVSYTFAGTPALAVDSAGKLLYAAGCADSYGCSPGFSVYSTAAPYSLLASYGTGVFGTTYCSIAVDPLTRRVFLSECNLPNENPSYVDVYDAADLKHRAARIGPLTPAAQLAIDAKARVLYVTSATPQRSFPLGIDSYGLDDGYAFLGSFPVRSVHHIAVAPFAP